MWRLHYGLLALRELGECTAKLLQVLAGLGDLPHISFIRPGPMELRNVTTFIEQEGNGVAAAGPCAGLCPAGKFGHTPGLILPEQCDSCDTGQYSAAGSAHCQACQAGQADDDQDPATPCIGCPVGSYAGCGATSCTACPDGTSDADADPSTPCTTFGGRRI